jgi:hypothetical protein
MKTRSRVWPDGLFVRHGVYKSSKLQQQQWADQIAGEIATNGNWDLTAYRQSEDVQAPHIFVFTSDGVLVEAVGFIPGLIGSVKLLDESIFAAPKTVTVAATGETWREHATRLKGGVVALECNTPEKKDHELHRIGQMTSQAIGPAIQVEVDFVEYQGKTVVRIFVSRSQQPLYHVEHEIYVREQTASMRATPEQVEHILTQFYG